MRYILIIPDIHGRTFWKDSVEKYGENAEKIVFLGDYLDSYPWECALTGITRKNTIENFKEIIQYKKDNPEKVILLLGNHDVCYYNRNFGPRIRYDSSNAWTIGKLFANNRSLFQLSYEVDMDKHYLFTHAGVLKSWYEKHKNLIGEMNAENLNKLKETPQGILALCDISYERGGYGRIGSMIWSDINEKGEAEDIEGIYQVFGHSQQEEYPIITKNWACLDCRKAFILTEEGGFQEV